MRLLIEHAAQKAQILMQAQAIICLNERKAVSSIYIHHPLNCRDTDVMVPVVEVTFYTKLWLHYFLFSSFI